MRADNEHDPLDSWLNQQVRPLPPPPGTFELIKGRARRRKLRKLAVTVVSAAAVAAAVAFAVPNALMLHLSPSSTNGSSIAEASRPTPTGGGSESPQGTASRYVAPTPSAPAGTPYVPSGPVPANFQPSSVTFVSQDIGWAIGQAGTPGQCANANGDICTSIVRTGNGGNTWQGGHAPSTSGVSGIRFLNGTNGWAFGPELWATHDGGDTWHQVSTGGQRVTDLETVDGYAYALFATCASTSGGTSGGTGTSSFAANCTSFTLEMAAENSDSWAPVGGQTTGLTDSGDAASAVLALSGSAGYLLAPDGTVYSGPIGGTWASVGTAPCQPGTPQASGLPGNASLALVNSTQLAIACQGTAATSPPDVYTSGDSGTSWTRSSAAWGASDVGTVTSLAAAPDGALVLATTDGIYVLPVGGSSWKATSATGSKAPASGFTYVGMTTDGQGVAVPADGKLNQIWMTFDGGLTWGPVTAITPGN